MFQFGVTNSGYKATRDCTDGLSSTIMMSERVLGNNGTRSVFGQSVYGIAGMDTNPVLCAATAQNRQYIAGTNVSSWGHGSLWAFGHPVWSAVTTVLPPNSPSCYNVNGDNPSNAWASIRRTACMSAGCIA